jgi:hypothetical protein
MSNLAAIAKATVGLVQMGKCEKNVTMALRTFYESGITTVIIVDENRSDPDYANEPMVANHYVQIFCERNINQAERRLSEASCQHARYILELPPTFYHHSRGLVEILAGGGDVRFYRQLAIAPRYHVTDDYVGVGYLFLLTHLVWAFFSLINRWKTYRGTYAVLRRVTREIDSATIAYDMPGPWRKMEGAQFCPVGGVSALNNFLYMMTRERTGFWRWLLIFVYARLATFPWLALIRDPSQWKALFPPALIVFWLVQMLVALIYVHQYYPEMPHSLFQAAVLPMVVIPWFLLCVYAKLFWRGYQGTRPVMHWPALDDAPNLPGFGEDDQPPTVRQASKADE